MFDQIETAPIGKKPKYISLLQIFGSSYNSYIYIYMSYMMNQKVVREKCISVFFQSEQFLIDQTCSE